MENNNALRLVKRFELSASDIQHCIIALLFSDYMKDHQESYQKLDDMLTEMNKLCWEGNDYTIEVVAKS